MKVTLTTFLRDKVVPSDSMHHAFGISFSHLANAQSLSLSLPLVVVVVLFKQNKK